MKENQGPVRGIHFHQHLPLFASGADSGDVRVWNYKQKRCLFVLKGHIDYIRTVYFHHQLPWILSASDDQTMRIWNYQSRNCVNIITGHLHYVMSAQFHHEKNLIVSASLDSSVRIWDYSILKKKLAEAKYSTGYIGIEIECIKILEGHERGCNWATFHPEVNIIASGSDDRKIKLWKYTSQVAWQHATILGHKNNVSCLLFDPITQNLITNSEDKTLRMWNTETKTEIINEKKQKARFWILSISKDGSSLASGHDEGLDMFQLNIDKVPFSVLSSNVVAYANGLQLYMYYINKKTIIPHSPICRPKDKNSICYFEKITVNPFCEMYCLLQVFETVQNQRYFMVNKVVTTVSSTMLQLSKEYNAYDSCFLNESQLAILVSPTKLEFSDIVPSKVPTDKVCLVMAEPFSMKRIFSSNKPNQLMLVANHNNRVYKFHRTSKTFLAQIEVDDIEVTDIVFGPNRVAIVTEKTIVIANENLEKISVIKEKFAIKSVFWESQQLLFYTNINHLKCAFMTGQTEVMGSIDGPMTLIKQLNENTFLAFSSKQKVFEIQLPEYKQLKEFKIALAQRKIDKIKGMLQSNLMKGKKKIFLKHLVQQGFSEVSLKLLTDSEEKFSLAIQSSNFQLAFELCNKVNTQQYWKMLGEEALKQGIYEAYELSCQKLKNFDQLNFLYSLQSNTEKLQKVMKIAKKTNNTILAFNTNLFINNGEIYEQLLRESGLESLAEFSRQAHNLQFKNNDLLTRLKSRALTPCQPVGAENFANWPHNVEEEQQN